MSSPPVIAQYLNRYAEKEISIAAKILTAFPQKTWNSVVVIPACAESELLAGCLENLRRAAQQKPSHALAIIVLNGPDGDQQIALDNAQARRELHGYRDVCDLADDHFLCADEFLSLLIIDRSIASKTIPTKEGVGLARKIGCDIALALQAQGIIALQPIRTTDADARVANDYFSDISDDRCATGIYRYCHIGLGDKPLSAELCLYEISLRYYLAGLQSAGSPYAFATIGSTLAMNPLSYAQVRGFPKKNAAEDFHILNKLAKVGSIRELPHRPIELLDRLSSRVPFGTGAGTQKIQQELGQGQEFRLYHPMSFNILAAFLRGLEKFALTGDWQDMHGEPEYFPSGFWEKPFTLDVLKPRLLAASHLSSVPEHRRKHLTTTFDALKTLQFIHFLRDEYLSLQRYDLALQTASFITAGHSNSPAGWLAILRV